MPRIAQQPESHCQNEASSVEDRKALRSAEASISEAKVLNPTRRISSKTQRERILPDALEAAKKEKMKKNSESVQCSAEESAEREEKSGAPFKRSRNKGEAGACRFIRLQHIIPNPKAVTRIRHVKINAVWLLMRRKQVTVLPFWAKKAAVS